MDKERVYVIGPSTDNDMEKIRQAFPDADILAIPYPDKQKKEIRSGGIGLVVLNDYIGKGKESLLASCLGSGFSRIAALNADGDIISLSTRHILELFISSIVQFPFLPIRFFYAGAGLLYSQIRGLFRETRHEIIIGGKK